MPAVKGDGMRGLAVFISDIRNCKSKEAEIKRINKELANIRSKFRGDKTLDGYQKKKYVCKLLFIFLLGHDIDFGHMEAVNLLSSNKYTEKQIGYLFISVLISSNSELIRLIVQSIKNDLQSKNPIHLNLALQCIANIGSRDMCEAFGHDIPKLLVAPETVDSVKQSAALCLLRLLRTSPEIMPPGEFDQRVVHLLNDQHMGVVTAACSLLEALAKRWPDAYQTCVPYAVTRLSRIVTSTYTDLQDYTYYFVPAPWLCVKLLRLLQNYPPPEDPAVKSRILECLETVLNKAQEAPKSKKVQHSNARNAVLFEVISYIIHMDSEPAYLLRACNQLGQFLTHKETNLRYLALESMCLLATSEFSHEAVKKHQDTIINALKTEKDVSVRQRAVDLLYAMCDKTNAREIVAEMLNYLESSDYSIREEMVLKVAILAEKYALDYTWYVDVILNLIRIAGDFIGEEVWYRVIQIVVNRQDVQGYAAKMVFEALQAPSCHENMVKVGGYILGEFGNLIAGDPRSSSIVQFSLLHSKYHLCSITTRALLLSTYVKFVNLFPEIKRQIQDVLSGDSNLRNPDAELQQRSIEYLTLSRIGTQDLLATVLEEMPHYSEKESSLLAKLKRKDQIGVGRDSGLEGGGERKNFPHAVVNEGMALNSSVVSGGTADLLGLGAVSPTTDGFPGTASADGLTDIFGSQKPSLMNDQAITHSNSNGHSSDVLKSKEEDLKKFLCKSTGVLYEDSIIQIGVKMECKQNLTRLGMFYGNKTALPFSGVTTDISCDPSVLNIQAKPLTHRVEAGAQIQQLINVECLRHFSQSPVLRLSFSHSNDESLSKVILVQLPIFLNKFMEPIDMDRDSFFQRWKHFSSPTQESQKIVNCIDTIEADQFQTKLAGFGMMLLSNVDPNAHNFVGAGVVNTKQSKIGVLCRIEPNYQAKSCRLTIRCSVDVVAQLFCQFLSQLF